MVTCAPKTAWTDPAVGDLVILDATGNYFVDQCADTERVDGIVRAVGKGLDILTVELFTAGCIARLPYSVAPALGNQPRASATPGAVKAGGGKGVVIGLDVVSGTVDVLYL